MHITYRHTFHLVAEQRERSERSEANNRILFEIPRYLYIYIYIYIYIRRIKRFPAKTFTNVGMVQRVIKNRVRAPTHHTGNKSPDTRRGSLASLAIHNPCRSRFIAFKRLCIHCTQVNILRLQVTLKPLSPSLTSGNMCS